jgi:8-amino-7-oxononanoate synthase
VFTEGLNKLQKRNLIRHIISRSSPQGPTIKIKGKTYINFSTNDYLGLAGHPEIIKAATKATEMYAFGSGASRLLAGGCVLHEKIEKQISEFKGTESALVFNSGYSANTGIIPAIASEGDLIFSDELNHASVIDGCRLSRARKVVYRHRDMHHLRELLKKNHADRKIIITDTVFSMDGDIAPLNVIYELCKRTNSIMYLDDAHGTGILGRGKGALSHFGIKPEQWIIQMGTFSKAMGSFGAFVAGGKDVIQWISNTARSFIFSTALPPCIISASIAAIKLIRKNPMLIKKLSSNRKNLVEGLRCINYDIIDSETPIIPIKTRSVKDSLKLSSLLLKKGIYAPAIRPPTVKDPRIRITVSAAHTDKHIQLLLNTLDGLK